MAHDIASAIPAIHPSAIVEDGALVGPGVRIWHRSHIRAGSRIGEGSSIGFSVFVDAGAVIGAHCKIQNHVSIYHGVILEDDVFVGPSVTFTNDRYPRANALAWEVVPTTIRRGASIGANATIVCGVDVGQWSMVAAGSVVTKDVPPHALVVGSPARIHAWVCRCGRPICRIDEEPPSVCSHCGRPTPHEVRS